MQDKMTRLIIWGIGSTARQVINKLKPDVEVVAIVDSYKKEEVFFDKKVILPQELKTLSFDYILIASVYAQQIREQLLDLCIEKQKVLYLSDLKNGIANGLEAYRLYVCNFFEKRLQDFVEQPEGIDTLVTGISYHNDGIAVKAFKNHKVFNWALRGEDLFYNYEVIKFIYDKYPQKVQKVRHCIVGLNYYSFEYDLSKSRNAGEIERYYPYIKNGHNWVDDDCLDAMVMEQRALVSQFSSLRELLEENTTHLLNDEAGERTAYNDFNKNYPHTVRENKIILRKYLCFLQERNIRPIILVMPVTRYYRKYVNCEKKQEFYKNLHSVLEGYPNVQVLDYFDAYELEDNYWYHVNHLNAEGAKKFTQQLEKDIKWM